MIVSSSFLMYVLLETLPLIFELLLIVVLKQKPQTRKGSTLTFLTWALQKMLILQYQQLSAMPYPFSLQCYSWCTQPVGCQTKYCPTGFPSHIMILSSVPFFLLLFFFGSLHWQIITPTICTLSSTEILIFWHEVIYLVIPVGLFWIWMHKTSGAWCSVVEMAI